jgi:DNA-binding beta-propeller fold protein YncE
MRARFATSLVAAVALLGAAMPSRAQAFELKYLYDLATLGGNIKLDGLEVSYDANAQELFATGYGVIRIFNPSGVQTFSFRTDAEQYGYPIGVAALEDGDLFLLTYRVNTSDWRLFRANYRGEPQEPVMLRGLPPEYRENFRPNAIAFANGNVYLADRSGMRVLLVDEHGGYVASYDLAAATGFADSRAELGISGFNVDKQGNLLFTVASLFTAYVMSLDGNVRSWGKPGGAPGKFNVISGIASDDAGRFYVVDSLKSAVIAFDAGFNFLGEFGYRGRTPGKLISPKSVAVGNGNLYVAQNGQRGVTVYRIAE